MAPRASILATEVEWLNSIKADLVVFTYFCPSYLNSQICIRSGKRACSLFFSIWKNLNEFSMLK